MSATRYHREGVVDKPAEEKTAPMEVTGITVGTLTNCC